MHRSQVRDGERQDKVSFQLWGFPYTQELLLNETGNEEMRKTIENDKALHHWRLDARIAHEGIKLELQSIWTRNMQRHASLDINHWQFIKKTKRMSSYNLSAMNEWPDQAKWQNHGTSSPLKLVPWGPPNFLLSNIDLVFREDKKATYNISCASFLERPWWLG